MSVKESKRLRTTTLFKYMIANVQRKFNSEISDYKLQYNVNVCFLIFATRGDIITINVDSVLLQSLFFSTTEDNVVEQIS